MKDYFLRDGEKLKKIGIKMKVRYLWYEFVMKIICNLIMKILTKIESRFKI